MYSSGRYSISGTFHVSGSSNWVASVLGLPCCVHWIVNRHSRSTSVPGMSSFCDLHTCITHVCQRNKQNWARPKLKSLSVNYNRPTLSHYMHISVQLNFYSMHNTCMSVK